MQWSFETLSVALRLHPICTWLRPTLHLATWMSDGSVVYSHNEQAQLIRQHPRCHYKLVFLACERGQQPSQWGPKQRPCCVILDYICLSCFFPLGLPFGKCTTLQGLAGCCTLCPWVSLSGFGSLVQEDFKFCFAGMQKIGIFIIVYFSLIVYWLPFMLE